MSLADELLADLDDVGDELGNEENDQVFFFSRNIVQQASVIHITVN